MLDMASESFNICPRQGDTRCTCSSVSLSIHDHAPFSPYKHDEPRNSIPHRHRGSTHASACRAEVSALQRDKQVGAAVASAFQLTTPPNVSQLSSAISKNPAAKALLSEMELSPTALHSAEIKCHLSIQAQEEDKEVKQADVQSPKKGGTQADEIPVTLYRDRIAQ